MKTVQEWFSTFPKEIQKAWETCNAARNHHKEAKNQKDAINIGVAFIDTEQGFNFWAGVYQGAPGEKKLNHESSKITQAYQEGFSLWTLSDDGAPPESSTQTTTTMHKYADTPVATPTLVFGTDVTDMKPDGIMATIKANNARIKDLTDTGIESPFIVKQIAGLNAANEALVKQLDTFA